MSRLQAMRDILRPLEIYNLKEGSVIYAELAAYDAGLETLEETLNTLEREAFLSTAQDYGIASWEKVYGKIKNLIPVQKRREMLLYRGAIHNQSNTRRAVEEALTACGLRVSVKENLDGKSIYLNCSGFLEEFGSQDEIKKAAEEFLPCHLEAVFDFRTLDWEKIDSLGNTFSQMDAAGMTWNQIDAYSPDAKEEI